LSLFEQNIIISSHPQSIRVVEEFMQQFGEKMHLAPDVYANALITLTEAVNNAIIHGNKLNVQKKVHLTCQCSDIDVCFIIKDEGMGFDPDEIPDPTSEENVSKLDGRGVFIMRQLCDEISFEDNGRSIKIKFKL